MMDNEEKAIRDFFNEELKIGTKLPVVPEDDIILIDSVS